MEKARAARTNVAQAIRLKDDEGWPGCSLSRAAYCIQKKAQMNQERVSIAFTRLHHWNLVADPGTHSYKEIMPAVLYGWEIDMACLPPFQHIIPGKCVTPFECNLAEDIHPLALDMKLERVAAYRKHQGYSHQIYVITQGRLSLDDIKIPSSCCLDPVRHSEFRSSDDVGDVRLSYLCNKETGANRAVLTANVETVRTCILGLDEV